MAPGPQTSMRTPNITTETLEQVGFEGKTAEIIQILANGSELNRTDLQNKLEASQPTITKIMKDLATRGIVVETIHYDGGQREGRFKLSPQKLCKMLDRRADELRQASIEIEKAFDGFSEEPGPPRTPPAPPVAPPIRPATPEPPPPVARTPAQPASPNGSVKLPSPFHRRP